MPVLDVVPRCIERGRSYPLDEFCRITRLGKWALRSARRAGLEVRYLGGRAWVSGDAWFDHLERAGRSSNG